MWWCREMERGGAEANARGWALDWAVGPGGGGHGPQRHERAGPGTRWEENVELAGQARWLAPTTGAALYPRGHATTAFPSSRARSAATACRAPTARDIPGNFAVYNEALIDKQAASRGQYAWWKTAFEVTKNFDHDIRALRGTTSA